MPCVTIDSEICKGCSLCVYSCPRKILSISENNINSKGYYVVEVTDKEKCTGCASCAMVCPDIAITVER